MSLCWDPFGILLPPSPLLLSLFMLPPGHFGGSPPIFSPNFFPFFRIQTVLPLRCYLPAAISVEYRFLSGATPLLPFFHPFPFSLFWKDKVNPQKTHPQPPPPPPHPPPQKYEPLPLYVLFITSHFPVSRDPQTLFS